MKLLCMCNAERKGVLHHGMFLVLLKFSPVKLQPPAPIQPPHLCNSGPKFTASCPGPPIFPVLPVQPNSAEDVGWGPRNPSSKVHLRGVAPRDKAAEAPEGAAQKA